jgi:signal peptidase I
LTELSSTVPLKNDLSASGPGPSALSSSVDLPKTHLIFPSFLDAGASLLKITVIALFVLTFLAQPFRIPSESMERTLLVGDFLLVNKAMYASSGMWHRLLPYEEINRGDVVVFHFPLDASQPLVKRVIGLPGDHIRIQAGQVYVNGKRLNEPYVVFENSYWDTSHDQFPSAVYSDPGIDPQWWREMRDRVRNGDLVIPPDRYFVLGDNRNHSRDSRYWGFVPRKNMMGHPFLIYFSLREPSTTDAQAAANDRLGHDRSRIAAVQSFARWDRMFHVVR